MKKTVAVITALLLLLLSACGEAPAEKSGRVYGGGMAGEFKGVWISYIEFNGFLSSGSREEYEAEVRSVLSDCRSGGINAVFLHVRPFCDAFYPSDIFGWSAFATSLSGAQPYFDPLDIFISLAHAENVAVHAWINPYRLSFYRDLASLTASQRSIADALGSGVVSCEKGLWLDPSSSAVRRLVLDGAAELMDKYDIDGIHMDDYFYPVAAEEFDSESYEAYLASGGSLELFDWRRENVDSLVKGLYDLIKSKDEKILFSISPQADIEANRNLYFADVALWGGEEGYVDALVPQIYFGYTNSAQPFAQACRKWEDLVTSPSVALICGLASYKQADPGQSQGAADSSEWSGGGVIEKQIADISADPAWQGWSLYSYSYAFGE